MDRVLAKSHHVRDLKKTQLTSFLQQSFDRSKESQRDRESLLKKSNKNKEKFIDLMFYKPPETDILLNRVVAFATKEKEYRDSGEAAYAEFAHVEISFCVDPLNEPFEEGLCMGFSITQKSNVFFKPRAWRSEYKPIRVTVENNVYSKLYQTCRILAMQNICFDKFAMYTAILCPDNLLKNRDRANYGTYCSKIITEVLQQYKIGPKSLQNLLAYKSTPSLLYKCLKNQDEEVYK
jgi:hypothetical protein